MQDLVKVGIFPDELQLFIDSHFKCHDPDALTHNDALRRSVKGIIMRSNAKISTALIDSLPALKVIATNGVGYDGIPMAHARRAGITVTNTPGVLDDAVCELGIGLLLAMLREIPASDHFVRTGGWRSGSYLRRVSVPDQRLL